MSDTTVEFDPLRAYSPAPLDEPYIYDNEEQGTQDQQGRGASIYGKCATVTFLLLPFLQIVGKEFAFLGFIYIIGYLFKDLRFKHVIYLFKQAPSF